MTKKGESWIVSRVLFSKTGLLFLRAVIYLGRLLPNASCGSTKRGTGKRPTVVPLTLLPTGVYRASASRRCWCALTAPLHPYQRKDEGWRLKAEIFHTSYFILHPFHWRYVSVALSSRSLALGVTQQVWSFGSPDFPQTRRSVLRLLVCNCLRLLSP